MDDPNQQQTGSDTLPKDLDCDTSFRGISDEKITQELPKKTTSDVSKSDAAVEALNTNGIDKKSDALASNNFSKGDGELTESQENTVQDEKTSVDNLDIESKIDFSAVSEGFSDSLKKCDNADNQNNSDFEGGDQIDSYIENSNKCDVKVHQEVEPSVDKTMDILENQLDKNTATNLSEKSKLCESFKESEIISDVKENSKELSVGNEINNLVVQEIKEQTDKNEELNVGNEIKDPTIEEFKEQTNSAIFSKETASPESLINESLIPAPIKDVINVTEDADNSQKILESECKISKDSSSSQITQVVSQENKAKTEENENATHSTQQSSDLNNQQENSQMTLSEGTKEETEPCSLGDSHNNKLQPEAENQVKGIETQSELKNIMKDTSTSELDSKVGIKIPESSSKYHLEAESKSQDLINLQSDLETKPKDTNESQSTIEVKEVELYEGTSDDSQMEITPIAEVTNPQKNKKSDEVDECITNQKHSEEESEKQNPDSGDKNSVQEYNNTQHVNTLNFTSEHEEEESMNRSENEGNEIMDTEIVNCNEIEQIDLSESETDLKGDIRDEEPVSDSLETPVEKVNEGQITDERENSGEGDKSAMLIDDEGVNQPGNSEEETITGDTTNQPTTETKEKDDEICIIPDDVIPALSILPQNKEQDGDGLTVLKVTQPESVKPKTRAQDKRIQGGDSKLRPVRNAAKLAGNKIKSLVESDLVFDERNSNAGLEGENDFQENTDESAQMCAQCQEVKVCKLLSVQNDVTQYLCSEQCSVAFKSSQVDTELSEPDSTLRQFVRKCGQCHSQITIDENRLFWETVDFCNEDCLGKYQLELGSSCANCKKSVPSTSLGKYCVRFGYDIKQFCSALCLEEYKKGLKVCSYCQKDISTGTEGFLAPVGSKGQFKDFCTQSCMEKYDRMSSNKPLPEVIEECAVCSNSKPVQVEVELDNKTHKLCSEPCFAAFKFVNNITEGQCDMCRKYFDRSKIPNYSLRLLFYDETLRSFCSKTCMNVYILANRKIVPCNWCKVKKYNFDMIKKLSPDGQLSMMCSLNCLMLYQTSVNAVCSRPIKCDFCKKKFVRQPLYHLTMSDATLRNFCSYNCVMSFQNGYPKQNVISGSEQLAVPIPTGGPKRIAPKRPQVESSCVPVISSVQSLASPNGPVSPIQISRGDVNMVSQIPASPIPAPSPQVYQQIITKPAPAKQMKNKSILCKPYSHTKGVSCRPHPCMKETQTDQSLNRKFLIPIPVPIYVPAPMHMFATPFPVPVPFPLPVPVPIFIPTTRNSAKGIMKEIKKIQEKIPTDPFEAELLMMAEMVAGDKKQDPTDSESEDGNDGDDNGEGTFSPENVDTSNTFGDDMLQMALKMASELEEPAVDMESVLTSNTITTSTQPAVDPNKALYASDTDDPDQVNVMAMNRGRKRSVRGSRNSTGGTPSKRGRRTSGSVDVPLLPPPEPVPPRTIEVEKPDANMCLKYTFGVNAWRHWVMQKNAELEKAAMTNRKIKLFKPELLQLTADELNFSLCLFVKEVRKPNGTEYAPDTIYYLCLGIQQYLFENGRIDNIFTDSYYEKFTDCLDEVAKKFAALYNDSQYIVTRVEEEHLWESKQLGAHSPHVLLSTLMFFNTKHFNLVTVEEHMQLSFSHIMKHWKRNPNTPGVAKVPGSRNVLLRFYPPQSALEANSRKKKVYEQQENEENPLRCPVKLYEFYLSKCPESVKTRNDVFYLLPERSCVPDSPVWYSTMALGKEPLMKMLHRIKMVKEINIALLTS